MVSRLVLVLGDQLSEQLSALKQADKDSDIVVMAEVADEASYVRHHPKKIALIFAAMRKFARSLEEGGWTVAYSQFDDTENSGSIVGELLRRADQHGASEVLATEPGEWRLIDALKYAPMKVHILPDDRFIASHEDFEQWAEGRKALRMEYFYRDMRRKTGLLMDGDKPVGDKWNFDHDNRKPAPDEIDFEGPLRFEPDDITSDVGCFACLTASQQRSMSPSCARAKPQITECCALFAISLTAAKSPSDAIGNPASMISTPISSKSPAISSFSAWVIVAPGLCSPSRNVVSKINT